jgi:hypothetical protein
VTDEVVAPTYPVIQYGHIPSGGDGIGSGYVYTGEALPELRGKYIFSDLSTGRVWFSDFKDMLAADDGDAATMAPMHEVKIRWNGQIFDSFTPIAGRLQGPRRQRSDLPAVRRCPAQAGRRAICRRRGQQLCVYNKTDGMIRRVVGS